MIIFMFVWLTLTSNDPVSIITFWIFLGFDTLLLIIRSSSYVPHHIVCFAFFKIPFCFKTSSFLTSCCSPSSICGPSRLLRLSQPSTAPQSCWCVRMWTKPQLASSSFRTGNFANLCICKAHKCPPPPPTSFPHFLWLEFHNENMKV